jgi:hypothetical protein
MNIDLKNQLNNLNDKLLTATEKMNEYYQEKEEYKL